MEERRGNVWREGLALIFFQCHLLKKNILQQWQRPERLRFKREDLDLCPQLRLEDKEGQWEESQLVI